MVTQIVSPENEQLYSELTEQAALVRRVGLCEALAVIHPSLRDRVRARTAVYELNLLAEHHRRNYSSGAELNHADFLRGETRDVAGKLGAQLAF